MGVQKEWYVAAVSMHARTSMHASLQKFSSLILTLPSPTGVSFLYYSSSLFSMTSLIQSVIEVCIRGTMHALCKARFYRFLLFRHCISLLIGGEHGIAYTEREHRANRVFTILATELLSRSLLKKEVSTSSGNVSFPPPFELMGLAHTFLLQTLSN
jgi:hypothetical protein